MSPGEIVAVDWRDARARMGEANKIRPGVIVGAAPIFGSDLPFEIVVPLTGEADLAIPGASVRVDPTIENGCSKPSYALSWNVQSVPHGRIRRTPSRVTDEQLAEIRMQIASCVGR